MPLFDDSRLVVNLPPIKQVLLNHHPDLQSSYDIIGATPSFCSAGTQPILGLRPTASLFAASSLSGTTFAAIVCVDRNDSAGLTQNVVLLDNQLPDDGLKKNANSSMLIDIAQRDMFVNKFKDFSSLNQNNKSDCQPNALHVFETPQRQPFGLQHAITDKAFSPSWSSLFTSKPRNAGDYTPQKFVIKNIDGVMIPPKEVINDGSLFWKDQLVGFFQGDNPSYSTVKSQLRQRWKLKGRITMRYDNHMFFFEFSNLDDRRRILESTHVVIDGQPFIVIILSPSVDSAREQVLLIPVWVCFRNIPTVLQSMIWIDCLTNLLGDLV